MKFGQIYYDPSRWYVTYTLLLVDVAYLPRTHSLLIGSNIQVFGGVWLKEGFINVLSQSIPLYYNLEDERELMDFWRFLTALQ